MERILIPILRLFAWPRRLVSFDEAALAHLDRKTGQILFAVIEAIVGEEFLEKVPDFVPTFDDYLSYQRRKSREDLTLGLLLIENPLISLWYARRLKGFSRMSLLDRQNVLAGFKQSRVQMFRKFYAGVVRIGASSYYASESTWSDIHYAGVSVDHPQLLTKPLWRPGDDRPIAQ